MLRQINDFITRVVETLLWIGFLLLIITVALQVLARFVLHIPLIWAPDLAQLLFAWLIFLGAAVALRKNTHYTVDIIPYGKRSIDVPLEIIGFIVTAAVIYLMFFHGITLTELRKSGVIQSLGISRMWAYASIPVSGALMALYAIEALLRFIKPKGEIA